MADLIYISIIVVLGATAVWLYKKNLENERDIEAIKKERDKYIAFGEGISEYQAKLAADKETAKTRIMDMLKKTASISNKDVKNKLDVSDATATRYLDELEKEGKLKQSGRTGRSVRYK